jgi:predicted RNA-binding Zn-ribbon protein involved in translation (DUF1610 family)
MTRPPFTCPNCGSARILRTMEAVPPGEGPYEPVRWSCEDCKAWKNNGTPDADHSTAELRKQAEGFFDDRVSFVEKIGAVEVVTGQTTVVTIKAKE